MLLARYVLLIFFGSFALHSMEADLDRILELEDGQVLTIRIINGELQSYTNRRCLYTYLGYSMNYVTIILDKNSGKDHELALEIERYINRHKKQSKEYQFERKEKEVRIYTDGKGGNEISYSFALVLGLICCFDEHIFPERNENTIDNHCC